MDWSTHEKDSMDAIEFASGWRAVFAEAGLATVDDFMRYEGGTPIGHNRHRQVLTFVLDTPGGPRRFYMKRFIRPHLKDMLATLRRFRRPCSQAECEWRYARTLLAQGIETYHPVCHGSLMRYGFEQGSFFVTEEIQGQCLTDYIAETWKNLSAEDRRMLLVSLGRFVRRVHEAGISFPDLYAWHIYLLDPVGPSSPLALIDLHRMRCGVKRLGERLRNLGALEYSLLERYFDDDAKRILFEAYRRPEDRLSWEDFRSRVLRRAGVLRQRRRHAPDY